MNLVLALYFSLHCLRNIIFGSSNSFHSVVFDYSQYSVINANIHNINNTKIKQISGIAGWTLFGLSPNSNDNYTVEMLYTSIYNHDKDKKDVEKVVDWFHENRFTISISSFIIFASVIFITHIILKICCKCKGGKKNKKRVLPNGINTSGTVLNTKARYFNPTYISFIISIALVCYCNITTVTFSQLFIVNKISFSSALLTVATCLFFVLGFPIFIISVLYDKNIQLFDRKTMDSYGSLYMEFKTGTNFMLIVILRQIIYAVVINLSGSFNILQNSIMLTTNIIFLFMIFYIDPYVKYSMKIQNTVLTSTLIIVSCVNFVIIYKDETEAIIVWYIASMGLQILSFILYLLIVLYEKIKPLCGEKIVCKTLFSEKIDIKRINDDEFSLISYEEPIDYIHNDEYQKMESIRLIDELNMSRSLFDEDRF